MDCKTVCESFQNNAVLTSRDKNTTEVDNPCLNDLVMANLSTDENSLNVKKEFDKTTNGCIILDSLKNDSQDNSKFPIKTVENKSYVTLSVKNSCPEIIENFQANFVNESQDDANRQSEDYSSMQLNSEVCQSQETVPSYSKLLPAPSEGKLSASISNLDKEGFSSSVLKKKLEHCQISNQSLVTVKPTSTICGENMEISQNLVQSLSQSVIKPPAKPMFSLLRKNLVKNQNSAPSQKVNKSQTVNINENKLTEKIYFSQNSVPILSCKSPFPVAYSNGNFFIVVPKSAVSESVLKVVPLTRPDSIPVICKAIPQYIREGEKVLALTRDLLLTFKPDLKPLLRKLKKMDLSISDIVYISLLYDVQLARTKTKEKRPRKKPSSHILLQPIGNNPSALDKLSELSVLYPNPSQMNYEDIIDKLVQVINSHLNIDPSQNAAIEVDLNGYGISKPISPGQASQLTLKDVVEEGEKIFESNKNPNNIPSQNKAVDRDLNMILNNVSNSNDSSQNPISVQKSNCQYDAQLPYKVDKASVTQKNLPYLSNSIASINQQSSSSFPPEVTVKLSATKTNPPPVTVTPKKLNLDIVLKKLLSIDNLKPSRTKDVSKNCIKFPSTESGKNIVGVQGDEALYEIEEENSQISKATNNQKKVPGANHFERVITPTKRKIVVEKERSEGKIEEEPQTNISYVTVRNCINSFKTPTKRKSTIEHNSVMGILEESQVSEDYCKLNEDLDEEEDLDDNNGNEPFAENENCVILENKGSTRTQQCKVVIQKLREKDVIPIGPPIRTQSLHYPMQDSIPGKEQISGKAFKRRKLTPLKRLEQSRQETKEIKQAESERFCLLDQTEKDEQINILEHNKKKKLSSVKGTQKVNQMSEAFSDVSKQTKQSKKRRKNKMLFTIRKGKKKNNSNEKYSCARKDKNDNISSKKTKKSRPNLRGNDRVVAVHRAVAALDFNLRKRSKLSNLKDDEKEIEGPALNVKEFSYSASNEVSCSSADTTNIKSECDDIYLQNTQKENNSEMIQEWVNDAAPLQYGKYEQNTSVDCKQESNFPTSDNGNESHDTTNYFDFDAKKYEDKLFLEKDVSELVDSPLLLRSRRKSVQIVERNYEGDTVIPMVFFFQNEQFSAKGIRDTDPEKS